MVSFNHCAKRNVPLCLTVFPTQCLLRWRLRPVISHPTPHPTFLTYTVQPEETIFSIAERFGLRAETILWANQAQLHDNPHRLKAGMVLRIPPVDGCFYIWRSGDTLEQVAQTYGVNAEVIVNWAANGLDPQNPAASLAPGKELFIPGGRPPFGQATFPTPATPQP